MILYHGTNLDIQSIDLALCRPYKDFGRGFYTTELPEQAQKMAVRVAKIYGGSPIVNVYQAPDDLLKNTKLCVMDFGNIPADDDMTVLFRQYQNHMLSMDMLINGMTYKEVTSQYSFHTERAVKLLKKAGVLS